MKKLTVFIIFILALNLFADFEVSPDLRESYVVPSDDMWDILYTFEASASSMPGIETDDENIYTATWNNNIFSRYEMDGTYLEDFTIDGVSNIRDMAYDGTYFYGSPASMTIYIMDLENETLIGTIPVTCAGISGVRHIAYDPQLNGGNGGFWVGNWQELAAIAMDGSEIYSFLNNPGDIYGSAHDPWGDGGPFLWLFSQGGIGAVLHQFDIQTQMLTGVTHNASDIPGYITSSLAGGLASTILNTGQFVLLANIQQEPNLIGLYEINWAPSIGHPGIPTNVSITPDEMGELEVYCNWICPAVDVTGNPLDELLEMHVYRNDELIYTDENPIIGEVGNFFDDTVPDNGLYEYRIVGYNTFGEGIPYIETVWVGEDVPAAVTDFLVIIDPITYSATLTWTNPTEGLHGGAFNEPILGYHLERSDGVIFELTGIQTEFIDNTIPSPAYYYYTIVPYNLVGDGGSAQSNITWPPPEVYIIEDFYTGCPPPNWQIIGDGQDNWSASQTNNAGGTAPEAMFSFTPSFDGTSRLTSYPVNTSGRDHCTLLFNHHVNDYAGLFYVKVETSSDLINWNTAWEVEVTGDIGPIQENIQITTPDVGSETFHLAFTFEGYSSNIDYWYIDDVFCIFEISYNGFLSLDIELIGGNGNIEEVEVEIGDLILNPDSTGNIFVELPSNLHDISATLENYFPAFENDVYIVYDDTTFVDIALHYLEPPSDLVFEIISNNIELNWQAPETLLEVTSYNVYKDDELIVETTDLTFTDETVSVGLHEYYISVNYGEHESESSNIVEVYMTNSADLIDPIKTEITSIYPNPFNPITTITYSIKNAGNVTLDIYNIKGQKVKQLVNEQMSVDHYTVIWNGKDNTGKNVSSGIYFCKLKTDDITHTKRVMLLK